jgi:hypothetical protein
MVAALGIRQETISFTDVNEFCPHPCPVLRPKGNLLNRESLARRAFAQFRIRADTFTQHIRHLQGRNHQ